MAVEQRTTDAALVERLSIHLATCKPRKQGLACSHCFDLTLAVERAAIRAAEEDAA